MSVRIDYRKASPGALQAMLGLVKTRVSRINGCAYYLDMHTKDARAAGANALHWPGPRR